MDGQDKGLEDPSLSSQSAEPPLGQGGSRQKFEQWSHQSEHSDWRVQEAQCRASHQEILDAIFGRSCRLQEVNNHRLGLIGERMLQDRSVVKKVNTFSVRVLRCIACLLPQTSTKYQ